MFVVHGYIGAQPYTVSIIPNPGGPGAAMSGSEDAIGLVTSRQGEQFQLTPTGPTITIDVEDAASLLGALHALTDVAAVEGDDIPQVIPPENPNVDY